MAMERSCFRNLSDKPIPPRQSFQQVILYQCLNQTLNNLCVFSATRHVKHTPPVSSSSASSSASSGSSTTNANAGAATGPARRVQIFNSSDSFSPDQSRELTVFSKPESSKEFLRTSLSAHYLFEALGAQDMERIVDCMRPTFASPDEVIIQEGDVGDLFFCLETGSAIANVRDAGNVFTYSSGGCFGELALIYNSPRAASVIASGACKLWALDLR